MTCKIYQFGLTTITNGVSLDTAYMTSNYLSVETCIYLTSFPRSTFCHLFKVNDAVTVTDVVIRWYSAQSSLTT